MSAPDPIPAILDQLDQLSAREATHHAEVRGQLTQLDTMVASVNRALAEDAAVLARVDDLDTHVAELTRRLPAPGGKPDDGDSFTPAPPPAWWKLTGDQRQKPMADLHHWVEHVFRPGYGYLAGALHPCWPAHDLALYALDIASQLWCALYLQPDRTPSLLSAQAEYQTRILPALATQIATETGRCTIHPANSHTRSTP